MKQKLSLTQKLWLSGRKAIIPAAALLAAAAARADTDPNVALANGVATQVSSSYTAAFAIGIGIMTAGVIVAAVRKGVKAKG
jgi:hypothetical protein